jgi:hypothetical protein
MPSSRPLSSSAESTHNRTSIVPVPSCMLKDQLVVPGDTLTTLATNDICDPIQLFSTSTTSTRSHLGDIDPIDLKFSVRMSLIGIYQLPDGDWSKSARNRRFLCSGPSQHGNHSPPKSPAAKSTYSSCATRTTLRSTRSTHEPTTSAVRPGCAATSPSAASETSISCILSINIHVNTTFARSYHS